MSTHARVVQLLVAILVLPGCAGSTPGAPGASRAPSSTGGSGITGVTTVDGGCPVLRPDSPCPDRPLRSRLTVTAIGAAASIATVDTDDQGRFRIVLPPGSYTIQPQSLPAAPLPRAAPVTVHVGSGRFATVAIRFDSGIRRPIP